MSVTLITENIWQILSSAAKKSKRPAHVAVAYLGKGAAELLPLPSGSRLVVDASESTVKSGQTCPKELIKLYKNGVRIYSIPKLHAKIFVFGSKAFVGSANVSYNSAESLIEVILSTKDKKVVSDAKDFINERCLYELGPKTLEDLDKIYRPPKGFGVKRTNKQKNKSDDGEIPEIDRLQLAQLIYTDPPPGSESAQKAGLNVAKKRMEKPKRHKLCNFWLSGKCYYKRDDIIIQVHNEGNGHYMISPPARIHHIRKWNGIKTNATFIYMEVPNKKRVGLKKLATQLDCTQKILLRDGKVSREIGKKLLKYWEK